MGNFVYIYPTHGHLHWTFWQNISQHKVYVCTLWWWPEENIRYTFFRQSTTFTKLGIAFVLGLQTLLLQDFSEIYRLKGLKPKNKGHTNFYECCDLTKKVYLVWCEKKQAQNDAIKIPWTRGKRWSRISEHLSCKS